MREQLAYPIHLGSDKNRKNKFKKLLKEINKEQHHFQIMEYKIQHNYQE